MRGQSSPVALLAVALMVDSEQAAAFCTLLVSLFSLLSLSLTLCACVSSLRSQLVFPSCLSCFAWLSLLMLSCCLHAQRSEDLNVKRFEFHWWLISTTRKQPSKWCWCLCARIETRVCTHTHIHTRTHTHARTYTHTHAHARVDVVQALHERLLCPLCPQREHLTVVLWVTARATNTGCTT